MEWGYQISWGAKYTVTPVQRSRLYCRVGVVNVSTGKGTRYADDPLPNMCSLLFGCLLASTTNLAYYVVDFGQLFFCLVCGFLV
jgi:hypothetical protein